ncbi:hypothetical protein [Micromonospora thermarum]|uniref:Uncharacterized protein n=1 Tax=Micromonospora thermarum TaxID=2720024 RepID=A0ABX0Z7C0_9ACTN|nr:hypothetical protein [Micromonospora thermarum]NJP31950.1 hypothetical protein [Micromonospora thermarum]
MTAPSSFADCREWRVTPIPAGGTVLERRTQASDDLVGRVLGSGDEPIRIVLGEGVLGTPMLRQYLADLSPQVRGRVVLDVSEVSGTPSQDDLLSAANRYSLPVQAPVGVINDGDSARLEWVDADGRPTLSRFARSVRVLPEGRVAGRGVLDVAQLETIAQEAVVRGTRAAGAPEVERCVVVLQEFSRSVLGGRGPEGGAGAVVGAGRRGTGSVDDMWVGTRRGERRWGSDDGWVRVGSPGDVERALAGAGAGAVAEVLAAPPSLAAVGDSAGRIGHAWAAYHTSGSGVQWLPLTDGLPALVPAGAFDQWDGIANASTTAPPGTWGSTLAGAVDIRVRIIDVGNAVRTDLLTSVVESESAQTSIVDPADTRFGALGDQVASPHRATPDVVWSPPPSYEVVEADVLGHFTVGQMERLGGPEWAVFGPSGPSRLLGLVRVLGVVDQPVEVDRLMRWVELIGRVPDDLPGLARDMGLFGPGPVYALARDLGVDPVRLRLVEDRVWAAVGEWAGLAPASGSWLDRLRVALSGVGVRTDSDVVWLLELGAALGLTRADVEVVGSVVRRGVPLELLADLPVELARGVLRWEGQRLGVPQGPFVGVRSGLSDVDAVVTSGEDPGLRVGVSAEALAQRWGLAGASAVVGLAAGLGLPVEDLPFLSDEVFPGAVEDAVGRLRQDGELTVSVEGLSGADVVAAQREQGRVVAEEVRSLLASEADDVDPLVWTDALVGTDALHDSGTLAELVGRGRALGVPVRALESLVPSRHFESLLYFVFGDVPAGRVASLVRRLARQGWPRVGSDARRDWTEGFRRWAASHEVPDDTVATLLGMPGFGWPEMIETAGRLGLTSAQVRALVGLVTVTGRVPTDLENLTYRLGIPAAALLDLSARLGVDPRHLLPVRELVSKLRTDAFPDGIGADDLRARLEEWAASLAPMAPAGDEQSHRVRYGVDERHGVARLFWLASRSNLGQGEEGFTPKELQYLLDFADEVQSAALAEQSEQVLKSAHADIRDASKTISGINQQLRDYERPTVVDPLASVAQTIFHVAVSIRKLIKEYGRSGANIEAALTAASEQFSTLDQKGILDHVALAAHVVVREGEAQLFGEEALAAARDTFDGLRRDALVKDSPALRARRLREAKLASIGVVDAAVALLIEALGMATKKLQRWSSGRPNSTYEKLQQASALLDVHLRAFGAQFSELTRVAARPWLVDAAGDELNEQAARLREHDEYRVPAGHELSPVLIQWWAQRLGVDWESLQPYRESLRFLDVEDIADTARRSGVNPFDMLAFSAVTRRVPTDLPVLAERWNLEPVRLFELARGLDTDPRLLAPVIGAYDRGLELEDSIDEIANRIYTWAVQADLDGPMLLEMMRTTGLTVDALEGLTSRQVDERIRAETAGWLGNIFGIDTADVARLMAAGWFNPRRMAAGMAPLVETLVPDPNELSILAGQLDVGRIWLLGFSLHIGRAPADAVALARQHGVDAWRLLALASDLRVDPRAFAGENLSVLNSPLERRADAVVGLAAEFRERADWLTAHRPRRSLLADLLTVSRAAERIPDDLVTLATSPRAPLGVSALLAASARLKRDPRLVALLVRLEWNTFAPVKRDTAEAVVDAVVSRYPQWVGELQRTYRVEETELYGLYTWLDEDRSRTPLHDLSPEAGQQLVQVHRLAVAVGVPFDAVRELSESIGRVPHDIPTLADQWGVGRRYLFDLVSRIRVETRLLRPLAIRRAPHDQVNEWVVGRVKASGLPIPHLLQMMADRDIPLEVLNNDDVLRARTDEWLAGVFGFDPATFTGSVKREPWYDFARLVAIRTGLLRRQGGESSSLEDIKAAASRLDISYPWLSGFSFAIGRPATDLEQQAGRLGITNAKKLFVLAATHRIDPAKIQFDDTFAASLNGSPIEAIPALANELRTEATPSAGRAGELVEWAKVVHRLGASTAEIPDVLNAVQQKFGSPAEVTPEFVREWFAPRLGIEVTAINADFDERPWLSHGGLREVARKLDVDPGALREVVLAIGPFVSDRWGTDPVLSYLEDWLKQKDKTQALRAVREGLVAQLAVELGLTDGKLERVAATLKVSRDGVFGLGLQIGRLPDDLPQLADQLGIEDSGLLLALASALGVDPRAFVAEPPPVELSRLAAGAAGSGRFSMVEWVAEEIRGVPGWLKRHQPRLYPADELLVLAVGHEYYGLRFGEVPALTAMAVRSGYVLTHLNEDIARAVVREWLQDRRPAGDPLPPAPDINLDEELWWVVSEPEGTAGQSVLVAQAEPDGGNSSFAGRQLYAARTFPQLRRVAEVPPTSPAHRALMLDTLLATPNLDPGSLAAVSSLTGLAAHYRKDFVRFLGADGQPVRAITAVLAHLADRPDVRGILVYRSAEGSAGHGVFNVVTRSGGPEQAGVILLDAAAGGLANRPTDGSVEFLFLPTIDYEITESVEAVRDPDLWADWTAWLDSRATAVGVALREVEAVMRDHGLRRAEVEHDDDLRDHLKRWWTETLRVDPDVLLTPNTSKADVWFVIDELAKSLNMRELARKQALQLRLSEEWVTTFSLRIGVVPNVELAAEFAEVEDSGLFALASRLSTDPMTLYRQAQLSLPRLNADGGRFAQVEPLATELAKQMLDWYRPERDLLRGALELLRDREQFGIAAREVPGVAATAAELWMPLVGLSQQVRQAAVKLAYLKSLGEDTEAAASALDDALLAAVVTRRRDVEGRSVRVMHQRTDAEADGRLFVARQWPNIPVAVHGRAGWNDDGGYTSPLRHLYVLENAAEVDTLLATREHAAAYRPDLSAKVQTFTGELIDKRAESLSDLTARYPGREFGRFVDQRGQRAQTLGALAGRLAAEPGVRGIVAMRDGKPIAGILNVVSTVDGVSFINSATGALASVPVDQPLNLLFLPTTAHLLESFVPEQAADEALLQPPPPVAWELVLPDGVKAVGDALGVLASGVDSGAVLRRVGGVVGDGSGDPVGGRVPGVGVPVVVVDVGRSSEGRARALRTLNALLERYRWRRERPVVVSTSGASVELTAVVDGQGVVLVHEAAATAGGGLAALNNVWVVRDPDGVVRQVGDTLSAEGLDWAGGRARPVRDVPPVELVEWLSAGDWAEPGGDVTLEALVESRRLLMTHAEILSERWSRNALRDIVARSARDRGLVAGDRGFVAGDRLVAVDRGLAAHDAILDVALPSNAPAGVEEIDLAGMASVDLAKLATGVLDRLADDVLVRAAGRRSWPVGRELAKMSDEQVKALDHRALAGMARDLLAMLAAGVFTRSDGQGVLNGVDEERFNELVATLDQPEGDGRSTTLTMVDLVYAYLMQPDGVRRAGLIFAPLLAGHPVAVKHLTRLVSTTSLGKADDGAAAILDAVDRVLSGQSWTTEEMKKQITGELKEQIKDCLDGTDRVEWLRRLDRLRDQLPDQPDRQSRDDAIKQITTTALDC